MPDTDIPPSLSPVATTLSEIGAQVLVRGWLSANNIVFAGSGAGRATGRAAQQALTAPVWSIPATPAMPSRPAR